MANIYVYQASLVQGGAQINLKTVISQGSEELANQVAANSQATGFVYFDKANPGQPVTLNLQGYATTGFASLNYTFTVSP